MPVFEYKGLDTRGKGVTGIIDADGGKSARARLRKQGIFPTDVQEQMAGEVTRGEGLSREVDVARFFQRVGVKDVAELTTQLATLLGAGIPMVESLTATQEQCEKARLKVIMADVREKVNEGGSLADALSAHPKVFSRLYVNMVRAGEASGNLDLVLNRLAVYTEGQVRLRGKLVSAMIYPLLMTVVGGAIVLGLFVFVIPRIRRVLESFGETLPTMTRFVLALSNLFLSFWWLIFVLGGLGWWMFRRWKSTPEGRMKWDSFLLGLPLIGPIVRRVAVTRFCQTLSSLLDSGVPILTAIGIVEKVVQNEVLAVAIAESAKNIAEGESIAVPLRQSGQFPPIVTHMIAIGERTGELESMLGKVAASYEAQLETTLDGLTSLIEPLLILFMGGVVGFIAMAIMLPMLNMSNSLR